MLYNGFACQNASEKDASGGTDSNRERERGFWKSSYGITLRVTHLHYSYWNVAMKGEGEYRVGASEVRML